MPGATLLLTGFPAAGKTTLANTLADRLRGLGCRVALYDGDAIRAESAQPLGFSRIDRDRQVERVGELAADVTRRGGIAVCALVAPYRAARAGMRERVSVFGPFYEVHVATALEVCERRDPKGLYAAARSGEIAHFTGVSDPYETPESSEFFLDLDLLSAESAAELVIDRLRRDGTIVESPNE
jgi:sulfate adenylyltransferase